MSRKELIGKLTPAHFAQGESFDKTVFVSLIAGLQKQLSTAWMQPVIFLVMFGLGFLLMLTIGGAIGNGLMVVFIFLALIVGYLPVMGPAKQIKSSCRTLGITIRDINAAIQKVKTEQR
ncbi:MAG: hypothetical protein LBG19_05345 [Prevotellaceae bacterium]|jgi:hypothetical protein|nr:hypothetical protein [Prevotellaceae bacterium]